MREILFKAKRKSNGEWVEGSLISTEMDVAYIIRSKSKAFIPKGENVICSAECYEINSDTICQYTGLKDKNGRKIWENDIVKVSTNKGNTLCEVRYADNVAQFQLWQFTTLLRTATVLNLGNYEEKVIGNIFDNPDLVEVA